MSARSGAHDLISPVATRRRSAHATSGSTEMATLSPWSGRAGVCWPATLPPGVPARASEASKACPSSSPTSPRTNSSSWWKREQSPSGWTSRRPATCPPRRTWSRSPRTSGPCRSMAGSSSSGSTARADRPAGSLRPRQSCSTRRPCGPSWPSGSPSRLTSRSGGPRGPVAVHAWQGGLEPLIGAPAHQQQHGR
jgi:hypothetical protein